MLWRFRDFMLTKFFPELARGGPEAQAWALRTSWGLRGGSQLGSSTLEFYLFKL